MSFFLKKSNTRSKGLYLQIYQTFYVKGKGARNKSFQVIGYASDLINNGISDPISYAQQIVDSLNSNSKSKASMQIGEISTKKNVGYFLIKSIFDLLNLDRDINIVSSSFKSHYLFSDFLRTMVYAQVVSPGSKQTAVEKVIPNIYGATCYSYDQVLEGIKFLGSDFHKYIEVLNHYINLNWKRNFNTGYFDCTNYYFEIDRQDDYRRRGPSKENRHDPIIGQALLLDADMVPLDMDLYPGNESEKPFLRKRIEEMKSSNEIKGRIIQVADKGLNCARNIYAATIEANDGYIFSKSVHGNNLSKIEKAWVLLDNEENVWHHVKNKKGHIIFSYKECVDTFTYKCKVNPEDKNETKFSVKEKRIVTFNPALAKKKRNEILRQVDNLKNKITYKEAVKEELGDSVKYVKLKAKTMDGESVKIATELNQEKIDEDINYAGYNMLVTSEINASALEIYKTYHNLWEIEHSFRIMKTYLEARPVFVSDKKTIYGHFLIVYYALVLIRLLQYKIFESKISAEEIIDFIRDYQVTENFDGSFINNATENETYRKIKEKLGLSKLGNVYLKKRDVENLLKTEL